MLTKSPIEPPTATMLSPTEAIPSVSELPRRRPGAGSGGHAMHFVHQRAVVFLEPRHRGLAAARGKAARQPLQQPGAERVEPVDPAHIDDDAFDAAGVPGRGIDLRLQAAGVLGHPGAGTGELEPLALCRAFKQYAAHTTKPLIPLHFPGKGMDHPPGGP